MPTLPVRQRLLRGAFKYAQKLQELCRRATTDSDSSDSDAEGPQIQHSDNSDVSLTSLSSYSTSSGSLSAGYEADSDLSTDTEEELLFLKRLAALHKRINHLTSTRVLFPNHVHKLSQLYLVLVLYKEDDHKCFRQNLRVNPETFDALVKRIEDNSVFASNGPQNQLPVDEQLAIVLFRFGHYRNAASVEAIAQWAGVSVGMVVNATRRVMLVTSGRLVRAAVIPG
jgi:hypothetical protein